MFIIRFLIEVLVYGGALLLAARLLPGIHVRDYSTAVTIALVFAVLNFVLGGVLGLLVKAVIFLPAILTCGLLFFVVPLVVNACLLWLTDKLMDRFEVTGTGPLIGAAAFLAVAQALVHGGSLRGH